jgi:hypothetical protein
VTADNFLLSDTHHGESTVCQVKSILIQLIGPIPGIAASRRLTALAGAGISVASMALNPTLLAQFAFISCQRIAKSAALAGNVH